MRDDVGEILLVREGPLLMLMHWFLPCWEHPKMKLPVVESLEWSLIDLSSRACLRQDNNWF